MLVVGDERCAAHLEGMSHPESPARLTAVLERLGTAGMLADRKPARDARLDELELVHPARYVTLVRDEVAQLRESVPAAYLSTGDTVIDRQSYDVAVRAAGATLVAMEHAVSEKRGAFAIVRPPGHHAEPERGMGFCLFNSAAVAARAFLREHGGRALIIDFDYHHGNGTEAIVGDGLSYISTHASPAYPGTGAATSNRIDPNGTLLDVPLPLDYDTEPFVALWQRALRDVAARIRPNLIVVSAGYDFAAGDPVGDLGVAIEASSALGALVREVADEHCEGRALFVLEGGYDLSLLATGVEMTMRAFDAGRSAVGDADRGAVTARERNVLERSLGRSAAS